MRTFDTSDFRLAVSDASVAPGHGQPVANDATKPGKETKGAQAEDGEGVCSLRPTWSVIIPFSGKHLVASPE